MKIHTYIINLKDSTARREYMENLLSAHSCLDVEFVEAVDGRVFTDGQRDGQFDMSRCVRRYGRQINSGEIGCTLSHRKCCRKLVDSPYDYALILEDDISIVGDAGTAFNGEAVSFMQSEEPRLLFLSGDYWFWEKKKRITRIFYAVGSYAYYMNRAAARLILSLGKPYNVADDWDLYRRSGVRLYAVHPYVIDANIGDFPSDISQEHWGNLKGRMSLGNVIRSCYTGLIKRCLWKSGRFESKIRR